MGLAVYALSHFAVDLGCAYAVFSGSTAGMTGYLLYNFFAFAIQMPLGLLADHWKQNRLLAVLGAVLVAFVCCFPTFGLVGICILGLGNAMFHIGGGLDILNRSASKAAPLGIFVSPGALGLFLGTLWGTRMVSPLPVLLLLSCCGAMMLFVGKRTPAPESPPVKLPGASVVPWAALLFLVVVLRSFGGMAAAFPWKTGIWNWAAVAAVVLGKTCGGIAADHLGVEKPSAFSLLLAAVLFCLGNYPVCGVLALFCFNMTMPITLYGMARGMSGCKGFSFGLLTFALFLGFLPVYLGASTVGGVVMAAISLISAALLLPGLRRCLRQED